MELLHKETSRRYSTRVYETVRSMSEALEGMLGEKSQIHDSAAGMFLLIKRGAWKVVGSSVCEMRCACH